jgi:hypothetical protein
LLITALDGGTPAITPLSIYRWMVDDLVSDRWRRLLDQGLALHRACPTVRGACPGLETTVENSGEGAGRREIRSWKTPVGSLSEVRFGGWQTEWTVKTPKDYKTIQWIVGHTELTPAYENFAQAEAEVGEAGLVVVWGPRTPAMEIGLQWAGAERFCLDLALEVPELLDLYEAARKKFLEHTRILAAGPGSYVDWPENLTSSLLGPKWYRELLTPVYEECVPLLAAAGKRVMVHYDGVLSSVAEEIAAAPFHVIESLTEPPEGDMSYDQCRAAWPDKSFWGNINLGCYSLPPDKLRQEVAAKRERAGKRGLAFSISEDLPSNWESSIPTVLETLRELG